MSNIVSFNLAGSRLTLKEITYLYKLTKTHGCKIFFYKDLEICNVAELTKLVPFILIAKKTQETYVVVEGEDISAVADKVSKLLEKQEQLASI